MAARSRSGSTADLASQAAAIGRLRSTRAETYGAVRAEGSCKARRQSSSQWGEACVQETGVLPRGRARVGLPRFFGGRVPGLCTTPGRKRSLNTAPAGVRVWLQGRVCLTDCTAPELRLPARVMRGAGVVQAARPACGGCIEPLLMWYARHQSQSRPYADEAALSRSHVASNAAHTPRGGRRGRRRVVSWGLRRSATKGPLCSRTCAMWVGAESLS